MTTNALGRGTANLTVNLPKSLRERIKAKARESNVTMSTFVRVLLEDAMSREIRLETSDLRENDEKRAMFHDVRAIIFEDEEGESFRRAFSSILLGEASGE